MIGTREKKHEWVKMFDLDNDTVHEITASLDEYHYRPMKLDSLEDRRDDSKYLHDYACTLELLGLHPKNLAEISLSEALLPVDTLPMNEKLRQRVRRGIVAGIGMGLEQHFSDYLQDLFVDTLAGSPSFNLEFSGLLDRMIHDTTVNSQLVWLNQHYHNLFRLKLVGNDRLPFALPAVLYYQIALRIIGHKKEAEDVARLNRFILDGHPPLGMLDDNTFAILGR